MVDKTINLTPFHCEQEKTDDGFVLTVFGKTEGGKTVKVRLRFAFWFLKYLARDVMWKAIHARQEEVNEATAAMSPGIRGDG